MIPTRPSRHPADHRSLVSAIVKMIHLPMGHGEKKNWVLSDR